MKIWFFHIGWLWCSYMASAQPLRYSVANAHAHNDYENAIPFYLAYNEGFGSIEADIFWIQGTLIVAHDYKEVLQGRTLQQYYILPLLYALERNQGSPYADSSKPLQMLIDIKTDPAQTLNALMELLQSHPPLVGSAHLKWVITGNRPAQSQFNLYPAFLSFDGELSEDYGPEELKRISMLSDNFRKYSHWNGQGQIPAAEVTRLNKVIEKAHALHKAVRFWNAPDAMNAWREFMKLGVDFINTDQVTALSYFLERSGAPDSQ
jgi:alkaline phosphatase